jgi:hypothetical protein
MTIEAYKANLFLHGLHPKALIQMKVGAIISILMKQSEMPCEWRLVWSIPSTKKPIFGVLARP